MQLQQAGIELEQRTFAAACARTIESHPCRLELAQVVARNTELQVDLGGRFRLILGGAQGLRCSRVVPKPDLSASGDQRQLRAFATAVLNHLDRVAAAPLRLEIGRPHHQDVQGVVRVDGARKEGRRERRQ